MSNVTWRSHFGKWRTWEFRDMGWRHWWNWHSSFTPFGHCDQWNREACGRFHWNGNFQLWIGPFCITRKLSELWLQESKAGQAGVVR